MNRICLFPGTFDPLTLGHVDIINRALPLFDRIIVGIGLNAAKGPMFTPEQRLQWIQEIYKDEPRVQGAIYDGNPFKTATTRHNLLLTRKTNMTSPTK